MALPIRACRVAKNMSLDVQPSNENDSSGSGSGSGSHDGSYRNDRLPLETFPRRRSPTSSHRPIDRYGTFEVANVLGIGARASIQLWSSAYRQRRWPARCQILGCANVAECGGHMYILHLMHEGAYNYIFPICFECNSSRDLNYTGRSLAAGWGMVKRNAGFLRVAAHEALL